MKKQNVITILQKAIERAEKSWQDKINGMPDGMRKILEQDKKDLLEMSSRLQYFELMYGIGFELKKRNKKNI